MRRFSIKVCVSLLLFLSIILMVKSAQAITFTEALTYNDKYMVKYGDTISITKADGETITSDNTNIAQVTNNGMKIKGTGEFTLKVQNGNDTKEYKFFAWNACLRMGKYVVYNDSNRQQKNGELSGRTYLAVSRSGSDKSLKIDEYAFCQGGSYSKGDLKGKYITNYCNDKGNSIVRFYEYAFGGASGPVVEVTGLTLDRESVEIEGISNSEVLVATITPEDATFKTVTWKSSDENVVKVDNGKLLTQGAGEATVTASSVNGIKAKCKVVVKPVEATGIRIVSHTEGATEEIPLNNSRVFKYKLIPANSTDNRITIQNSNNNSVTVNKVADSLDQIIVKGIREGESIIELKTSNGKTVEFKVKVITIHPSNVTLNKTSLEMMIGDKEQLIATVEPENASYKDVTYTSSNTSVATVSDNGLITAIKNGNTTITAKTSNGKQAKCTVKVNGKYVTKLILSDSKLEMNVGDTKTLSVTIEPSDTNYRDVKFYSSNSTIASVTDSGKVTAKSKGTATITVESAHGENGAKIRATCSVTVSSPLTYNPKYTSKGKHDGVEYIQVKSLSGAMSAGRQGPDQCLQYAMKYASKILSTGKRNYGISYTSSRRLGSTDLQKALYIMAKEIEKGRPTVIRINGRGGVPRYTKNGIKYYSRHYVTCVGVRADADINNLKETDFYVLDPSGAYGHKLKSGYMLKTEHNAGHLSDAAKYPGYQIYVYADAIAEGYVTGADGYSPGKVVYRYPKNK